MQYYSTIQDYTQWLVSIGFIQSEAEAQQLLREYQRKQIEWILDSGLVANEVEAMDLLKAYRKVGC